MKKLFKLKEWLTLSDAAKYLSIVLGEEVSEADVLRLGLDGHLKLSVDFVNKAKARRGKIVPEAEAETVEPIFPLPGKSLPFIRGIRIREKEVLVLDEDIVTIDGVWDLPMIGSERLEIEHEYQNLTHGPEVTLVGLDGAFVESKDGVIYQLQENFHDNEYCDKESLRKPRHRPENYYPAGGLPSDSVLVVRTSMLSEFEMKVADDPMEKPLGERERNTVARIIAALAKESNLDLAHPYKAAKIIERITSQLGCYVNDDTIANWLTKAAKQAPQNR